ncbi:beta strand repeat-containing protein [Prosthecobacter sp.]
MPSSVATNILVRTVAIYVCGFLFFLLMYSMASAQSYTSTSATTAWNAARWNNSTDAAPYDTTYTANNAVSFTSGTYSFAGMGATLNVGNVTVASGVTVNFASIGSTYATGGAVRTIDVGAGGLFDLNGNTVSTAVGTGLIKNGAGVFGTGAGAFTGGFTLNAGTVIARGTTGLGSGVSNLLTLNGGTLASNNPRNFDNTRFPGGIVIGGSVQFGELATVVSLASSTANLSFANNVSLGSSTRTFTQGNNGAHVFSGIISNTSGGLTFAANASTDGRFDLTNAANTFTGDINVNGGEVRFTTDGSLGNAANDLIIDGGRFSKANDATTVTLGAGRTIAVGDGVGTGISSPGSGVLIYNGVIANKSGETGTWAKQGGGTLSLGGVSTYTGDTAINNGTVQLTTGNDRLPTTTPLSLGQAASANLGILDLNGRSQQIAGLNSVTGTNASTTNNTVTSSTAATLTLGGSGSYSYGDGTNANSGVITGAITLIKSGNGTQTLGDTNTYTGTTTISGGVLKLNSASALPGGTGSSGGTSGLTLNGGVLGLGVGDFTRALGTDVTQVQFTGSGGFAAYGADRTVNFGGAGATVIWNSGSFVPTGSSLILGAADTDKKITLQNAIDFGGATRTIQVIKGTATGAGVYDAKLAGAVSNGSYTQTGDGRLEVAGAITGTTFDQSATNGTLALTSSLTTTGAFTQSGTGSTTIVSGSGSISAGSFTQSGTGSATTVTGTGSIVSTSAANLTAGTLTLSAANTAFTAPAINIGGAALVLGASNQIANTASLVLTSGSVGWTGSGHSETIETFTNSGGTFVTGANTLIGTGATITWSGGTNTVSNGGLVQDAHFVISGGTNTVEGGATGGVQQLNTGGAGLEMSNGSTLTLNSDNAVAGKLLLKGDVSTSGDATVTIASGLAGTHKGNIDLDSGTRTFTVANGAADNDLWVGSVILNGAVTKSGAGKMTVTAANTYTGATTVSDGTLQLGDGGTTGSISSSSDIALTSSTATLAVNRSDSVSINQAITGSGNVAVNSGSTTLGSGSNSYSGTTTVNGGSLQVGSGGTGKSGTGATTVVSGSTILGSGIVQASSLTADSGSTIQAGDGTSAATFATLNFTPVTSGGTHSLQGSIILGIGNASNLGTIDGLFGDNEVGSPGYITFVKAYATGTGAGSHDLLSFNNASGGGGHALNFLTSSGTLQIVDGGLSGQKGQIFNMLDWGNLVAANFTGFDVGTNYRSGGLSGDLELPTLVEGLVWDVSQFTTSGILVVVPEPSRVLLVLLGGLRLLFRRRRING